MQTLPDGTPDTFEVLGGVRHHVWHIPSEADRLIILLHGFGASCFSWTPVISALARHGEVYAYDRPAFGFTERVDESSVYAFDFQLRVIQEVIDRHAKGRPVVLVGHSAGGQIAAEFALVNASMIRALVLEDPAILLPGGPPDSVAKLLRGKTFHGLGTSLVKNFDKVGDKILTDAWFDRAKLTREIWDGYHAPMTDERWPAAFWRFATAPRNPTIARRLGELSTRTLVVTGDHDKIVSPKYSKEVSRQLPNSTLRVIENCGHVPHEETPTEFLAAVGGFLSEL
ncbi:MAG: alpha/beta fold hydrolase [Micrococcales bacterium]